MRKMKKAEFIRIAKENDLLLVLIIHNGEFSGKELSTYKEVAFKEPGLQLHFARENGHDITFVNGNGEEMTVALDDSRFDKKTLLDLGDGFYCVHSEWEMVLTGPTYRNTYYAIDKGNREMSAWSKLQYEEYAMSQPMTDGEEIRLFFEEL